MGEQLPLIGFPGRLGPGPLWRSAFDKSPFSLEESLMEFHQLRYMVAVADEGTFSKAARRCHVSQPSLSHQIIKLEDELGEKLFLRTKKNAVLTPVGQAFLDRARSILGQIRQAKQEIEEFTQLERGTIAVGVLPTIAPYFFAHALSEFHRTHPQIEVRVTEDTTNNLLRGMEAGRLDMAILAEPLPANHFFREELLQEELWVAIPKAFPISPSPYIRRSELETSKFIVLREDHCLSKQCLEACHRARFQPQVVLETSQIETILALVDAGVGISLVPEMALRRIDQWQIQLRKLRPTARRTIVVARRTGQEHSAAGFQFCQALKNIAGRTTEIVPG